MSEHLYDKYIRDEKMKTMWCPGCGNGIILQAIIRAVEQSGVNPEKVVVVSGIGCSSRGVNYLKLNTMHTCHGRAIAYATGVKMANPELTVIVITGDGDCTSIGGNHFIHACRRNMDLTVVCFNNNNYGMTGGQFSPTTPEGSVTKTSVYGSYDPPVDLCKLAEAAGATYISRGLTYQPVQLKDMIVKGINHKGMSVIDVMSDCPSLYGRLNKLGDPVSMMKRWSNIAISVKKAAGMSKEELQDRVVYGEFVNDETQKDYTARYSENVGKAQGY